MADGEINVNVQADGIDDAADDVSDASGAMDGGGGGGGDGGTLATSIKGGIIGGLVSNLLGPLLSVLEPFTKLFEAFVAPLAQVLLRLFTPVLRFLIRLLPGWFDFVNNATGLIAQILMGLSPIVSLLAFLPSVVDFVSKIPDKLDSLPGDIEEFVNELPRKIGIAIGRRVPFLSAETTTRSDPGPVRDGTSQTVEEQTAAGERTSIIISGALTPFLDLITTDRNVDSLGVR